MRTSGFHLLWHLLHLDTVIQSFSKVLSFSLGSLASDALNGIKSYSYRLVIPAIVISLIVLSLNLLGDGLRDAFDPKLNN